MPPVNPTDLRLRVIPAIAEIDAAAWDACANPNVVSVLKLESEEANREKSDLLEFTHNPFISFDFLSQKTHIVLRGSPPLTTRIKYPASTRLMPKMLLTDISVRALGANERTDFWDAKTPAFGVLVGLSPIHRYSSPSSARHGPSLAARVLRRTAPAHRHRALSSPSRS